jgi:uncharacterized integral membrane protein
MNAKLLVKTAFLMLMLLLLVVMGMNNRRQIDFSLPPLLSKPVKLPAAIMYFSFFAAGVVTGTVLTGGRGKKAGSSGARPAKSDK